MIHGVVRKPAVCVADSDAENLVATLSLNMVPGGIRYSFPGVTLGDINAVNGPNLPSPRHGPVTPIVGHCELEFDLPQDCGVLWEGDVKLGHVIDRVDNRPETLIALAFGHVVDEADVLKLKRNECIQNMNDIHCVKPKCSLPQNDTWPP